MRRMCVNDRFARHRPLMLVAILGALLAGCGEAGDAGSNPDAPATQPDTQSSRPATTQSATAPATQAVKELPRIDLAGMRAMIEQTAAQDRVLVVDYWATTCAPCVKMFDELHKQLKALGDGVRPTSVTIDFLEHEPDAIEFLQKHDAMHDAYMLAPDSDKQTEFAMNVGDQWGGTLVVPAILVYDRNGELSAEFLEGGESAVPGIVAHVESLLNDSASEGSAVSSQRLEK